MYREVESLASRGRLALTKLYRAKRKETRRTSRAVLSVKTLHSPQQVTISIQIQISKFDQGKQMQR